MPPRSRARSRSSAATRRFATPRDLARSSPRQPRGWPTRLRAAGLLDGETGDRARAPAGRECPVRQPAAPGERALWHAQAARLLERERADAEAVALHLLRSEPSGEAATVAVLRAAAGAPASAERPRARRCSCGVRSPNRRPTAPSRPTCAAELGLALAAHVQPGAPALLLEAVELAGSPNRRAEIALSGARALGLAGHFDDAIELCRRGFEQPAGTPADLFARLEAELMGDAWLQASTIAEARERLRRLASSAPPLELWRIHAAWEAMLEGRPANEARALLAPALEAGALDGDADSLLGTFAKTGPDRQRRPRRRPRALRRRDRRRAPARMADRARPRKLHACDRARARRPDPRRRGRRPPAFDFKLANSPPAALIWSLFPLVDALTELGELDDADDALAAGGLLGDPPPGALATPLLLESRARLRLAQHRPADAHADLARRRRPLGRVRRPHPGLAAWRVDDCEALVALDDIPAARRLAEEHLELAERVDLPGPRGAGLRALAHTAATRAGHRPARAGGRPARASPRPARAHARARRPRRRAAPRQPPRRRPAPLRQALDLAERGGMRLLARRARGELLRRRRAGRAAPRSSPASTRSPRPSIVSPRSPPAGHSNREIAQQLYVTRRTVETHLTHAYQKLDITTRDELAACLAGGHETRAAMREPAVAG